MVTKLVTLKVYAPSSHAGVSIVIFDKKVQRCHAVELDGQAQAPRQLLGLLAWWRYQASFKQASFSANLAKVSSPIGFTEVKQKVLVLGKEARGDAASFSLDPTVALISNSKLTMFSTRRICACIYLAPSLLQCLDFPILYRLDMGSGKMVQHTSTCGCHVLRPPTEPP